jgi:Putative Ig domain
MGRRFVGKLWATAGVLFVATAIAGGTSAAASSGYLETYAQAIDPGRGLEAVSCVPGSTTCVVDDSAGDLLYATAVSSTSAATWTPWTGPGGNPGAELACPSASLCLVATGAPGPGRDLHRASSLGGSFLLSISSGNGVGSISCASASFCVSGQEGNGFIRYSTAPNTPAWSTVEIGSGAMTAASCLSVSFCAVVDDAGNVHVAVTEGGVRETAGWAATEVDGGTALRGLACVSTSRCLAVDGSGEVLALAIDGTGAATVTRQPVAGATDLDAVSCVATTCAASGGEGRVFASTDAGATWIERYGGSTAIDDVTCSTASLCAAVSADGTVITLNPATTVPPLSILPASLPAGQAGAPYAAGPFGATGGEPPYEWSATGLPPGLTIDPASGQISGTPLTAVCVTGPCPQPPGTLSPTIVVTDADGTEASLPLTLALSGTQDPIMVSIAGSGSGEVISDPTGIACAGSERSCEASFEYTSPVTLTATPAPGSTFEGWFGDGCSGTGGCQIAWDPKVNFVVARFARSPTQPSPAPPNQPPPPPGTKIVRAKISTAGTAAFHFKSLGAASTFQCALTGPDRKATYKTCTSPRTYRHLGPGRYTFKVRANGPGGTDATPAKHRFRIQG